MATRKKGAKIDRHSSMPECKENRKKIYIPALVRKNMEPLGFGTFSQSIFAFPCSLQTDDGLEERAKNMHPELRQFMKKAAKNKQILNQQNKGKRKLMSVNFKFRDRAGSTFGLHQRFPWDTPGVPFAGLPHFKAASSHGPGKYSGAAPFARKANNGRIAPPTCERHDESRDLPGPFEYAEANRPRPGTSLSFARAKRMLIGDLAETTPDYSGSVTID